MQLQTPLRVYTSDGELIGEFGEMRRTPIQLSDLPPLFIKAVLAAEDDSFYTHHGVDIKSLIRAGSQLITTGHIQTGGSTITMQVAKNYFLTQERTFARKFNEILLALQIEHELTKEEILELYLNKIFLGNRAYGVEAAAQVYYGRSIKDLSIAQWAMIAGLPKAPSANNPIANPERALQRRNWIIGRMHSLGYITSQQYDAAINEPLNASLHGSVLGVEASYAAEMVRREMVERFGANAYTDGYVAYTTLDSKLQRIATQAIVKGLLSYDARHGYRGPERKLKLAADGDNRKVWQRVLASAPEIGGLSAAAVLNVDAKAFTALLASDETVTIDWDHGLSKARKLIDEDHRGPAPQSAADVVAVGDLIRLRKNTAGEWELSEAPKLQSALISINADNGAIQSLVGGFDFRQSKFNRITQAQRQPGSGFKPFVYTAALESGLTPATLINDAPIVYQEAGMEDAWRPENDTGEFYGPTPLRQALYKSRNVVSVRVLQRIGIDTVIDYVPRFGFDKNTIPHNLSIALGSLSVTPLQMARAFAVFANTGYLIEPHLLQRVADRNGAIVYEAKPVTACPNCDQTPAAEMGDTATPTNETAATNATANAASGPLAPQVLDKRYGFIMDSMLRDVVLRGTATAARVLNRGDLAGKTGTTSGPVDTWFNGYSGGVVTVVWAGFDSNRPMGRDEYGATVALPIWVEYMRAALADRPERPFKQPEGVVSLRIDPRTGLQASPDQPDAVFEYFTDDHLPGQEAPGSAPSEEGSSAPPSDVSEHDLF
ncbi:MAG TPA: penicillin-binding protein 1A [Spongiibacteraceae bacterium]|nr:penicillin-binding protein 1A [Spongiibacteraceae bacterium]